MGVLRFYPVVTPKRVSTPSTWELLLPRMTWGAVGRLLVPREAFH